MNPELIAGKIATHNMIKGVGGFQASEPFCRLKKSSLQECTSLSDLHAERFIPIDVVAELEPLSRERDGWPHVTRWLCGLMGGVFVPVPQGIPGREDLIGSVGRLAKEAADVTQTICGAVADGDVNAAEIAAARIQIEEAMAVLATLDRQLLTMAGDR